MGSPVERQQGINERTPCCFIRVLSKSPCLAIAYRNYLTPNFSELIPRCGLSFDDYMRQQHMKFMMTLALVVRFTPTRKNCSYHRTPRGQARWLWREAGTLLAIQ
jgi:hypothetical protein